MVLSKSKNQFVKKQNTKIKFGLGLVDKIIRNVHRKKKVERKTRQENTKESFKKHYESRSNNKNWMKIEQSA